MSIDEFLLQEFRQSEIYEDYVRPSLDLSEIASAEVPLVMYVFLMALAQEAAMESEVDEPSLIEAAERLSQQTMMPEESQAIFQLIRYDSIDELCKRIPHHEGILILQRTLGGKFYRDHLMHMMRTMLLCHAIANAMNVEKNQLLALTLAGLFHDIAYPVSKAQETVSSICTSLCKCYPYFHMERSVMQLRLSDAQQEQVADLCGDRQLRRSGTEGNHATLGAIAFLSLWNSQNLKQYGDLENVLRLAAHAIAIHDSEIGGLVRHSRDPLGSILILADELQDWGRPVGWGESSWIAVADVEPFVVDATERKIEATFDYSMAPDYFGRTYDYFSPLLQVESKQENLSRLVLDGGFPELRLTYKLPKYEVLGRDSLLHQAKLGKMQVDLLKGYKECVDELLISGAMTSEIGVSGYWLSQVEQVLRLFDGFLVLCERVARGRAQLFLHYRPETGEYLIYDDKKLPTEIVARTNRKGEVQWSYKVRSLDKAIEWPHFRRGALALRTGPVFDPGRFDILSGRVKGEPARISESRPVDDFLKLLQYFPLVYSADLRSKLKRFAGLMTPVAEELGLDSLESAEIPSAAAPGGFLWETFDPRTHFFLLENSERSTRL